MILLICERIEDWRTMHLLEPEGLKEMHFHMEGVNFPVVMYICTDWEKIQLSYLYQNLKIKHFTSYELCRWCQSHNILFQILYPLRRISIIKNPYKYFMFLLLKAKLKIK